MRAAADASATPSFKDTPLATDGDIRRCAQVVFNHFGSSANLYALARVREAEREGNAAAVAIWVRIAGVMDSFEGMEASTSIH